ncbi:MAG: carboxypeptidase-like regulatory domain-containing protein [Acidobacteria bacterium]|nr:carboxypeptidase-like regulatory domain-containing protein [Acidobacteriota bacterium]
MVLGVALGLTTHAGGAGLAATGRAMRGRVVDQSNKPVAGAQVELFDSTTTGPDGRFVVPVGTVGFVIRKAGFESKFVRTRSIREWTFVLLNASVPLLPICSDPTRYVKFVQWHGQRFLLPQVGGVSVGPERWDIDYVERMHTMESPKGTLAISHGVGMSWLRGKPDAAWVWDSVDFKERIHAVGGIEVLAARGVDKQGLRWRVLGTVGEVAIYRDADERTARLFDQVMDGICIVAKKNVR